MKFCTSSLRLLIFFVMVISSAISCSKKESRKSVSLSFSQGQNSALSLEYKIKHIILQEADGKNDFFFKEWDCELPDACKDIIDGENVTLEFETTVAKDRSLQLLVIAEVHDSVAGTETMKFFYHGGRFDLNKDLPPFKLVEIESETNMAIVTGRYVPKANHPKLPGRFLTGEIQITMKAASLPGHSFSPELPAMKVLSAEIFGGYTNFFLFKNIPTSFIFKGSDENGATYSGVRIFNDLYPGEAGLTADSLGLNANGNVISRYGLNANSGYYFDEKEDGATSLRFFNERITGFFGANPDGRYLCADNDPSGHVFNGSSSNEELCSDATCSTHFSWADISVNGSVNGSGDSCVDNFGLNIKLTHIAEEEEILDFFGPFVGAGSTSESVDFDEASGVLSWNWNAQIDNSNGVPGMDIFVRTASGSFNEDDLRVPKSNGIYCDKLAAKQFTKVASLGRGNLSYAFTSTDLASPNFRMAVCFRKPTYLTGKYYQTGHIEDGDNQSSQLVELKLYKDLTTVAANFDYNGSGFSGSRPMVMTPVPIGNVGDMYVEIHNTQSEQITITDLNINMPNLDLVVQSSPGSTPGGVSTCGTPPVTLDPEGSANDTCTIRIDFTTNPNFLDYGVSVHNGFTYKAHLTNNASVNEVDGFSFVASTLLPLWYSDIGRFLDMFAPPNEIDIKHVEIVNDSGSVWFHGVPADGSSWGDYIVHNPCPASLPGTPANQSCIFSLEFNNSSGVVDGTINSGGNLVLTGGAYLTSTSYTTPPTPSEGDPYDFNNISGNSTWTFEYLNGSLGDVVFKSTSLTSGNFSVGYSGSPTYSYCDSATLMGGLDDSCEFDITAIYMPGQGQSDAWFSFPYRIGFTYRTLHFDLRSNHQ